MNICITGGAGFVGSHITDAYLALGHKVTIIDNLSSGSINNINPNANFYNIDITNNDIINIFKDNKFDIVNHHAAHISVRNSFTNPLNDITNNISGSINILEAAKLTKIHQFIFASSGGTIYGEQSTKSASETHKTYPSSPYGINKLTTELYINNIYSNHFITSILRYSNIYGPKQSTHSEAGVIPIFIKKLLNNQQPTLNNNGANTRDYIFISDVVNANINILNITSNTTLNISTNIPTSTSNILSIIQNHLNTNIKPILNPIPTQEIPHSQLNFNKAKKLINFSPTVNINKGIPITINYFNNKPHLT